MIFTESFLTLAGAQILTQTASGSTIVWTQCGCSQVADQATITAGTTAFDNFVCKGTAVAVFEQSGNMASISCSMSNGAQGCTAGNADIFGLWAHIVDTQGNASEDVLVLIAKRGSSAPTYFPQRTDDTTELLGIVDLSLVIADGVVQSINLVQSAFALAGDLQTEIDLREELADRVDANEAICSRAVTAHAYGQPTSGDDQEIYGAKKFMDNLEARYAVVAPGIQKDQYIYLRASNGGYQSQIEVTVGVSPSYDREITFNTGTIRTGASILPYSGCSLGNADYRWESIDTAAINLVTDDDNTSSNTHTLIKTGNTKNSDSGNLLVTASYSYNFDSPSGKYTFPYSSEIKISSILKDYAGSPEDDLYISLRNAIGGISDLTIGSEYNQDNASCIIYISTSVAKDLDVGGNLTAKCIPSLVPNVDTGSGSADFPIGAIAFVDIHSTQTIFDRYAGQTIGRNNVVDMTMYYALGDHSSFSQGNQISITSSMRFRLLSQIGPAGGMALVMRIE